MEKARRSRIARLFIGFAQWIALTSALILLAGWREREDQQVFAVWKNYCLRLTEATQMEAPLVNGVPNMKQAVVKDLKHDDACYENQVRKK